VQVIHRSKDGQSTVVARSITVIKTATQITLAGSLIGPNPVLGRASHAVIHYPPSLGHHGVARIYNMAGELVAQGADLLGSGKVEVPIAQLSAGVYLVNLEKMQGTALKARIVLKLALVR
jgi:hypothetical protein